ncbi:transcriptional regulator LldR [Corticibacter populi]|uniref:Transcriptional regulator LldR n=1 Tax=Corticibacter populi TaxID=1550736 RepID=A0A3M6QPB7_9BURK|nr:transcriptional regulator LldR [Corticibacter populi]RMX04855.1 transcriptional regulator LldR [Corticibacter populi]RZS33723.1 GntR family transcriptional regulator [Corticibacter populi]
MRLADHVAEKLLALVQTRGLQPGQRLPAERQLASELGVSRPSLREAIQKLVSQGVLISRRGDGTYVRSAQPGASWLQQAFDPLASLLHADPEYRYDVLEARHALESSTAWHAALRATPADQDKIRRCFDVMVQHQQSGNAELSARADAQFHLAIAEAAHNVVLLRVMHSLFELVLSTVVQNRRTMFALDSPDALRTLTAQHEALMQAICEGQAQRARDVIGQHLEYVRTTVRRLDEDDARRARSSRLPVDARLPLPLL